MQQVSTFASSTRTSAESSVALTSKSRHVITVPRGSSKKPKPDYKIFTKSDQERKVTYTG